MTGISDLQTVFGALGGTQNTSRANGAEARTATVSAAGVNTATGDDQKVSVSSTAGALAQVASGSDVRHEKVAQLQAAIASGTYSVSSGDIADKLISSMLNGGR